MLPEMDSLSDCAIAPYIVIMIPGAYGLAPAPVAHAEFGWGSIIGAGIQGAAAHAQLTAFLKKYNDSEEGRQEFFEEMKKQMKMVMNQSRGKKGRFRFPPMR